MPKRLLRTAVLAVVLAAAGGAWASKARLVNDGPWTNSNATITWDFKSGRLYIYEAHAGFEIIYESQYTVSTSDSTITYKILSVRRKSGSTSQQAVHLQDLVGQTFTVLYSLDTSVGALSINGKMFRN